MKKITLLLILALLCSVLFGCSKKVDEKNVEKPEITYIQSICELATLKCVYHNVAKSTIKAGTGITHWFEKDRQLWVEYKGEVQIGIEMTNVSIEVQGTDVTVYLPDAKVLGGKLLSGTQSYIYSENGWNENKITSKDQTQAINDAQINMEKSAQNDKALLLMARNRAQKLIENYINQIGGLNGVQYNIKWEYNNTETTNS